MKFSKVLYTIKVIAAYALLTGASGTFGQSNTPIPPQNVVQLSASGSVEVQQDLLSISMTTTRDGPDAGTVQNQLKVALDAALAESWATFCNCGVIMTGCSVCAHKVVAPVAPVRKTQSARSWVVFFTESLSVGINGWGNAAQAGPRAA